MSTTPLTQSRSRALAELYTQYNATLVAAVALRVNEQCVVDDACQTAWTRLTARPDIQLNTDVRGWLYTVAVREAWALVKARRLTKHGQDTSQTDDDVAEVALEHIADLERLALLAALKPAERKALILKASGYSYQQIAQLTGASYTAVNRRLREGRARLRAIETP